MSNYNIEALPAVTNYYIHQAVSLLNNIEKHDAVKMLIDDNLANDNEQLHNLTISQSKLICDNHEEAYNYLLTQLIVHLNK